MVAVLTRIADTLDRVADAIEGAPVLEPACTHPADALTVRGAMGGVSYACTECGATVTAEEDAARTVRQ